MKSRRSSTAPSDCGDSCILANVLAPAVGQKRADEVAAQLLESVDLLRIAKEDVAYFRHLGLEFEGILALTAAFELSVRLAEVQFVTRTVFEDPEKISAFLVQRFRLHDQEILGALFFDHGAGLIAVEELFKGSGYACAVDVRILMRRAMLLSATSLILWHSHPSGSTEPSQHDVEFTKRVAQVGQQLEVRLIDHLIVAPDGDFTSMRRERC